MAEDFKQEDVAGSGVDYSGRAHIEVTRFEDLDFYEQKAVSVVLSVVQERESTVAAELDHDKAQEMILEILAASKAAKQLREESDDSALKRRFGEPGYKEREANLEAIKEKYGPSNPRMQDLNSAISEAMASVELTTSTKLLKDDETEYERRARVKSELNEIKSFILEPIRLS